VRVPSPSPPLLVPGGLALSDSEKAESLADSLAAQFQPVNDTSSPAVIKAVDEVMRAYEYAPASEPQLTSPSEEQEAINGLQVGKTPGPNGVRNRALSHLTKSHNSFTKLLNAVLLRQYFPPGWKHACVISILKPGKDPTLLSSYRPISQLDAFGKLFEKILLTRVLREVNEHGLLRDEQFGFRPGHRTALQLARIDEKSIEILTRGTDRFRFPGYGQSLRHCMGRRPPLQAHYPQFPVHIFITARSKCPSNRPHPHVVPCGLVWPRADSSFLCCSVCM
jgi:hypothetical protein